MDGPLDVFLLKKITVLLVYTWIKAKSFFDIDITNTHNPSDQETIVFIRLGK